MKHNLQKKGIMKRSGVVQEETIKRQRKLVEEREAECEAVNVKEKAIQAQIEELQKQKYLESCWPTTPR